MIYRLLLLCLVSGISLHSYSQKILKDIASSDASANINKGTENAKNQLIMGDTLVFLAQDTTLPYNDYLDIWFTTGTSAYTKKLTSKNPPFYYELLTSFKGKIYYRNSGYSNLYAIDENTNTAVKVFDNAEILKVSAIGEWLYLFVDNFSTNTLELWKTDGTSINTSKVTDIFTGSHYFNNSHFLNTGDKIYFNFSNNANGEEPWITDGTASGTKILKDLVPGSAASYPSSYEKVENTVFFYAYNPDFPKKLWKTDGTEAGTSVVADAIEGNGDYDPLNRINYNNQLYFIANRDRLYKTDGSTATLVKTDLSVSGEMVKANNLMYFIRRNGSDYELWKSNGTTEGTEKIKTMLTSPNPYVIVKVLSGTSKIYVEFSIFTNGSFQNITQHWVSDGTTAGTVNINTLNPNFSTGSYANQLAVVGNTYYFTAYDAANGFELWKSDGTSVGTLMIKNINKSSASSNPAQMVTLNNEVYFSADDIKHGREIWKTDGTNPNTQLLVDYNGGFGLDVNYSSFISGMIAYKDIIIAQISDRLVKFNQTMPPTVFYTHGLVNPDNPEFIQFNNKVYYKGFDNEDYGYELFATDGNTVSKVKDFTTDYMGGNPGNFFVWGGLLYFSTDNYSKIWKSDGTEAGTVLIKDLGGVMQSKFFPFNGALMFAYQTPTYGTELWKTDGTEAGTVLVKDIIPGVRGSDAGNFVIYNNTLFFAAFNGVSNFNLYKSDGTSANTQLFANTNGKSAPVVFKNKLFFIDYDADSYWLWSTDGISSPVKVKRLTNNVMPYSQQIVLMNIDNKVLVFDILASVARHELWVSDGTIAGTKLVKVIRDKDIGTFGATITDYLYHNQKLYFTADDGVHGKELWVWGSDCLESLTITNPISQNTEFTVEKYIVGNNKINASIKVDYNASKYITLNPGFETQSGTRFSAGMSGCINLVPSSNSTANTNTTTGSVTDLTPDEPFFKNFPAKADNRPGIMQFLNYPLNTELISAYTSESNKHNEKNIRWIIDESTDKYILKMLVGEKEYIGYLPK